eukprot:TRINITY_DN417_c1_g1_i2.p1 TRINITY_DN417_c1_g1~~TRINITY_DN417_c1_g1_i2.p1  ORF type:complete len:420 (+),score=57.33 TRINITY_DN417_c1_g1_i2:91-1350(+)
MASRATRNGKISLLMWFLYIAGAFRSQTKRSADIAALVNASSLALSRHAQLFTTPKFEDFYVKERSPIGQGAFGKVFKAHRKEDNGKEPDLAVKEVEKKHFDVVEEQIMRLKLPFVVDLESKFESKKTVSLVTRLYKGGDIRKYTKAQTAAGKHVSTDLLKFWGAQMAYGLWVLHRERILYGDLKADNTFIVDEDLQKVVLGDFGLARTGCNPEACAKGSVGTATYYSPAIAAGGQRYGYEVDWWAHAVALFTMATGSYPFPLQKDDNNRTKLQKSIIDAFGATLLWPISQSHPDLFKYLMRILDNKAYRSFENDDARSKMIGSASEHPFLSNKFWHGYDDPKRYAKEIDEHWHTLCVNFAINTEKCVPIQASQPQPPIQESQPQPQEPEYTDSESESDSESDLVKRATCAGCFNFWGS